MRPMQNGGVAALKRRVLAVPGARRVVETAYRQRNRRLDARKQREIEERDRRTLTDLAGRSDLRLNVGSSGNHLDGWLSIDIRPDEQLLRHGRREAMAVRDGSADAVNSEHFIEHLTLDEARVYLSEAYRVLRPGGLIRTTTPNLRGLVRALHARPTLARSRSTARTATRRRPTATWSTTTSTPGSTVTSTTSRVWPRCCARPASRTCEKRASAERATRSCAGSTGTTPRSSRRSVLCVDAVKPA